ncbi:hypothetical protein [Pontiella sulfatireligans]|uniref:Glycoside hydrolase family 42 N-terminal domain-containing protein n=1 Tax=Pontiella sulfatireligans TaxID=2750658 RepID=A0A6C2ULB1_9BACT|nr:hypothetical protein [Pontiella sulfatireligans]VGO20683.1 hypothetical protein SCARR_02749 [Pontiella sulfatireligans]
MNWTVLLFWGFALPVLASPPEAWPYWPEYAKTPLSEIQPQAWRTTDDVIDGWDWSMPTEVQPAPNSLMGLQRMIGLNKPIQKIETHFPVNAVTLHWINWRDIEPEEGVYRWDLVKARIEETRAQGSDSVLRILTSAKAMGKNGSYSREKGAAPRWLEKYDIPSHVEKEGANNENYEVSHPEFHKRYIALIESFGKSGIPQMLRAAYVGYASPSFGDEGIGPDGDPHVIERLDAWGLAFQGLENRVFMGGPSEYGFKKGFGVRRGFVEMYLYTLPDENIGQTIDENGYVVVDENSPVLRRNPFHGEVNEEYEEAWATAERGFRFGKTTDSFAYRYFCANLRLLQMRCSYVHNKDTIVPELLPFVALELGRTVEDTPDIWCFMRESYLRKYGAAKNWERWLYQRDSDGFETEPAVQIEHPIKMWMVEKNRSYDYIARSGKRIGLAIDDRWCGGKPVDVAIKITYFDIGKGKVQMSAGRQKRTIKLTGSGKLKTATYFLKNAVFSAKNMEYDIVFRGLEVEAVISFVRVIRVGEV